MKQTQYMIYFSNGDMQSEIASSPYNAAILAKANRIHNGEDPSISRIHDDKGIIYKIKADLQVC